MYFLFVSRWHISFALNTANVSLSQHFIIKEKGTCFGHKRIARLVSCSSGLVMVILLQAKHVAVFTDWNIYCNYNKGPSLFRDVTRHS
jgi:hypothetical protein